MEGLVKQESKILGSSKKILIGFLTFVLIFGFFSKSLTNFFLPKVQFDIAEKSGETIKTSYINGSIKHKDIRNAVLSDSVFIKETYAFAGTKIDADRPFMKVKIGESLDKILDTGMDSGVDFYTDAEGNLMSTESFYLISIGKPFGQIDSGDTLFTYAREISDKTVYLEMFITEEELGLNYKLMSMDVYSDSGDYYGRADYISASQVQDNGMIKLYYSLITDKMIMLDKKVTIKIQEPYPKGGSMALSVRKGASYYKVPMSALVNSNPYSELKNDTYCDLYIIKESNGVLGKEYHAQKQKVKIIFIGDFDAIVEGLDGYSVPRVIRNVDFNIEDGSKVFIWE